MSRRRSPNRVWQGTTVQWPCPTPLLAYVLFGDSGRTFVPNPAVTLTPPGWHARWEVHHPKPTPWTNAEWLVKRWEVSRAALGDVTQVNKERDDAITVECRAVVAPVRAAKGNAVMMILEELAALVPGHLEWLKVRDRHAEQLAEAVLDVGHLIVMQANVAGRSSRIDCVSV